MPLTSCICRFSDFESDWYAEWMQRIYGGAPPAPAGVKYHRKYWEYAAIAQALRERGCLEAGKRGLGFAVGGEPLVSLFAALGPSILATDQAPGAGAELWKDGQYVGEKAGLFQKDLIAADAFDEHVDFRHVNMLRPDEYPDEQFDFVWSACAFEHLGDLASGLDFVKRSSRLLRPGGVAVHTTEYNVSSDQDTVVRGDVVLYRQQDMRRLAAELEPGCTLEPFDFDTGRAPHDLAPDCPPWFEKGRAHIKLQLGDFIFTSALLIISARESQSGLTM